VLTQASTPESLVLFGIMSLLLIRSFVEIDIINPYQVGSFLFYFAAGRLATGLAYAERPQPRGVMMAGQTGLQMR
jgi:exopolysaccharide production protein ExoQ